MKEKLIEKIKNHSAIIGIIGLGYVGIPLMLRFSEVGYRVIGFDIDESKIEKINSGLSYIKHFSDQQIKIAIRNGFLATKDFERVNNVDIIILCLPTPLSKTREPDLSYIFDSLDLIKDHIRDGQLISLESTTYPGTTNEVISPILKQRGFSIGKDFFLVYSPEREDPGNLNYNTKTTPKVLGGFTSDCCDVGESLYSEVIEKVVRVSSTQCAEMTKLLENIYRSVNIGLVNEMKVIADKMEIDIHEVISAASTKPFGFTPFYPGPGLGGHCIPIDPFYLSWKAKEFGLETKFIELAGSININMPSWVVNKLIDGLNEVSKSIKGSKVLILGAAYKKNIDDLRESPSLALMKLLKDKSAVISYHDPYISNIKEFNLTSIDLEYENIDSYDAVLISTDHDCFDYKKILKFARLIIDTRGIYKENHVNVVKA